MVDHLGHAVEAAVTHLPTVSKEWPLRQPVSRSCLICYSIHSIEADIARAFHAQCHITTAQLDWFVDSCATNYMTPSHAYFSNSTLPGTNTSVMFGDGKNLHVETIGETYLPNNIKLNDVLIVEHLTKPLLYVATLTLNQPFDILF